MNSFLFLSPSNRREMTDYIYVQVSKNKMIDVKDVVFRFFRREILINGSTGITAMIEQEVRTLCSDLGLIQIDTEGNTFCSKDNLAFTTPNEQIIVHPKKTRKKGKASDTVILSPAIKEEIYAAISQAEYENKIFVQWGFNKVFEKGKAITLLFYGEPGTGKTMMAQALAKDLKTDLKVIGAAEIETSEPGGTERKIKRVFQDAMQFFANTNKHQVILFDECDSLLVDRNGVGQIIGSQINTLLTSIEAHEGIIILTTNRLEPLDPALERRMTAKINFPFPTREQREQIWKRFIPKEAPLDKAVDFKKLAEYNLAGGNIKNAVLSAIRFAAYTNAETLLMEHFTKGAEREVVSKKVFEKQRTKRPFSAEIPTLPFHPAQMFRDLEFAKTVLREKKERDLN